MLYCFDIDGTLIRSFIPESGEAEDYDRVELLPGRLEKLATLEERRSQFALVTNQAGVAMGYQTEEQVYTKLGRVLAAVQFFGGYPTTVHCCVDHPKAKIKKYRKDEGYRKPEPGMLLQAMQLHSPGAVDDRKHTLFIGDMDTDRECAERAGVGYADAEQFFASKEEGRTP